jgi:hypothetical protein
MVWFLQEWLEAEFVAIDSYGVTDLFKRCFYVCASMGEDRPKALPAGKIAKGSWIVEDG